MIIKDSARCRNFLVVFPEGGERIDFRKGKHWQGNSFSFSISKGKLSRGFIYLFI